MVGVYINTMIMTFKLKPTISSVKIVQITAVHPERLAEGVFLTYNE